MRQQRETRAQLTASDLIRLHRARPGPAISERELDDIIHGRITVPSPHDNEDDALDKRTPSTEEQEAHVAVNMRDNGDDRDDKGKAYDFSDI